MAAPSNRAIVPSPINAPQTINVRAPQAQPQQTLTVGPSPAMGPMPTAAPAPMMGPMPTAQQAAASFAPITTLTPGPSVTPTMVEANSPQQFQTYGGRATQDPIVAGDSPAQTIVKAMGQAASGAAAGMGVTPINVQAAQMRAAGMSPAEIAQVERYNAERISGVGPVRADQVTSGQLAETNLDPYMNPYITNVINQSMGDLERQRMMTQAQQGAAAQAARAFGGSRQGIAQAETNRAFAEQGGSLSAGLRQAGFTQAQAAAQQDIASRMQAALANQAANLQAATTTGQFGMQQQLANQAAANEAAQFGAQSYNQRAIQQAQLQQQAAAANQAAQMQAAAANQNAMMQAQSLNQGAGLQAAQQRLGASNQLANIANLGFGMARDVQSDIARAGQQQQLMQQALIEAGRGQYAGYTGSPTQALQTQLGAFGGSQTGAQTQTTSKQPGFFDYLQTAASVMG